MEEKILIGRKGKEQETFLGPWQLNDLCLNGKWIVQWSVVYNYAIEFARKTGTILRRNKYESF